MSSPETVIDRLYYAKKRLEDLKKLNSGDLPGANIKDRQQLIMEFFFHLVGAADFLLQIINSYKNLGLTIGQVNRGSVLNKLREKFPDDTITKLADELCPDTRKRMPSNLYSEEWDIFRIFNFRHHVCHRDINPFHFQVGPNQRRTVLYIDPSNIKLSVSERPAIEELEYFWKLFDYKCQKILEELLKKA